MRHRILVLLLVVTLAFPALAAAQDTTTPANGDGPSSVVGTLSAENFAAAIIYPNPTVALIDASFQVPWNTGAFAPRASQIIGQATSPLFTSEPGTYQVRLPIAPTGGAFDIDGDGSGEDGLIVFALVVGSNIVGDSYLEQFEQGGMTSYLQDARTGRFTSGSLLAFAEDDGQQFPSASGPDGQWFTADDERQPIEAGYTEVALGRNGQATFDRSATVTMDTLEEGSVASPDYSDQSWVDALNSLIDRLEQRYAFTELRGIDWEAIRTQYVPMMQQAQDAQNPVAYFAILNQIATGVVDAHVSVSPTTADGLQIVQAYAGQVVQGYLGNIGAQGEAMSADPDNPAAGLGDNLLIVTVGESGPAHDAGWVPGTQIVSIDGKTIAQHRETVPAWLLGSGISTPEKLQILQTAGSLLFPVGATVTIGYVQPGDDQVRMVDMVAGQYPLGTPQPTVVPGSDPAPLETSSYTSLNGYTVIKWADFEEDIPERIAVLEAALSYTKEQPDSRGIVIDMRGNSGGWAGLYLTMASYFFAADQPMDAHVFDSWAWDDAAGGLVRAFTPDWTASSPKPDLAYTGPVAILVDQNCGSSCEFFSQSMQAQGRAVIVGQYATAGAGGNIDQVKMPLGFVFQYTVGRFTWAGTEELNLEGKGVVPDVRVPVTVDGEIARINGTDIVLLTAVSVLEGASATPGATPAASPVASPGASPVASPES